jgi:prepilin-type N-terminal cleavage/methylation domain-containing protein
MRQPHHMKGYSLMETTMVVAIIGILMAAFGTALYSIVNNARIETVQYQLDRVKKGLVGQSRIIPAGERDIRRYGFIGDIGNLPATLDALTNAGSLPNYSVDDNLQMSAGWRGPYEPVQPTDVTVDPWGNGIVYTVAAGTSSVTGAPTVATVSSKGPDGVLGTADDSVVEIYKADAFSQVLGYDKDPTGATMAGVGVTLSIPTGGVIENLSTTTDTTGLYSFNNVPLGERVLQLSPKLAYVANTALVSGNNFQNVTFQVQNLGKDSTSITSMTLTYTSTPVAQFSTVLINGTSVFSGTGASGTTINFSQRTVAGTGVIQEPIHFFEAAGLIMLVPDAVIGTVGTGGSLTINLNGFTQDMTGVTFSVAFSDGSQPIFTTKR